MRFCASEQEEIGDNYKIVWTMGHRSIGSVFKARHSLSGTFRAVKVLNKVNLNEESRHKLTQEVEILKSLDHQVSLRFLKYSRTIRRSESWQSSAQAANYSTRSWHLRAFPRKRRIIPLPTDVVGSGVPQQGHSPPGPEAWEYFIFF